MWDELLPKWEVAAKKKDWTLASLDLDVINNDTEIPIPADLAEIEKEIGKGHFTQEAEE
jgi:hypothetical protein